MRSSIFLLLTTFHLLSTTLSTTLHFNEEGEFTIVQFTDLHYCHYNSDEPFIETQEKDRKAQELQRDILRKAKPDLVVFSGDAVSAMWGALEAGQFESCWNKAREPVVEAGIPYAFILGNHDAEGFWNRTQIIKYDQELPLGLRKGSNGIPDTCNFVLPVFSSQVKRKVAANIWFFDTGSDSCDSFQHNSWGCVEESAMKWYDSESKMIKEKHGTNIHHLAFLHIPISEFRELVNNEKFYGVHGEDVGCPFVNTGFFDHVKKNDDISAMFVGHDHKNNIGGWHKGIELVYGQKSGYGGYGDDRGARIIQLKEHYNQKGELNVTRKHYIIFENGTIGLTEPVKRDQNGGTASCPYLNGKKVPGFFRWVLWNFKRWWNNYILARTVEYEEVDVSDWYSLVWSGQV